MKHGTMKAMADNADAPEITEIETIGTPELSPEAREAFENLVPLLVEPETLIQGLRFLAQRIPGFVQLTVTEERSMARTAHLPREAIDIGIDAAGAWDDPKFFLGWTGDDERREDEVIRRWDGVHREILTLAKGVYGANLHRKHARGKRFLNMYAIGRRRARENDGPGNRLRPYIEEMRKAFAKNRWKKRT
jgi:hypothetical protein